MYLEQCSEFLRTTLSRHPVILSGSTKNTVVVVIGGYSMVNMGETSHVSDVLTPTISTQVIYVISLWYWTLESPPEEPVKHLCYLVGACPPMLEEVTILIELVTRLQDATPSVCDKHNGLCCVVHQ